MGDNIDITLEQPHNRNRTGWDRITAMIGICLGIFAILFLVAGYARGELSVSTGDCAPVYIGPNCEPVCLLNVTAHNNSLGDTNVINTMDITVYNETGFDAGSDLAPLSGDTNSGIAVYAESGATLEFQADEDILTGTPGQWNGNGPYWNVSITFAPPIPLPNNTLDPILYIVVRTSGSIANLAQFNISINASGIDSTHGEAPISAASSTHVTADTLPPSVSTKIIADWQSSYIYYDSQTDVIFYGDDMPGNQTLRITFSGTADNQSGVANVSFPAAMGENGTVVDTAPFTHEYNISTDDTDTGTFLARVYDNVGNYLVVNLTFQKDVLAPTLFDVDVFENSDYLHYDAGKKTLYYGNKMGAPQYFYVNFVGTDDAGSGLWAMAYPGNDFAPPWNYDYQIPYNVSFWMSSGSTFMGTPTFEVRDLVNNTRQWTMELVRDTTSPSANLTIVEDSPFIHVMGDVLYYGANMNSLQPFTLVIPDGEDDLSGVGGTEFPDLFDLMSMILSPPDLEREYLINRTDADSGEYKIIVRDQVYNSHELSFSVIRDTVNPTGVMDVFEQSDYMYYDHNEELLFYGAGMSASQSFEVEIKMGADEGSGLRGVMYSGINGPHTNVSAAPYTHTYQISSSTLYEGALVIRILDNVGNEFAFEVELVRDVLPPGKGSVSVIEDSERLHFVEERSIIFYSHASNISNDFIVELAGFMDDDSGVSCAFFPMISNSSGTNITGHLRYTYSILGDTRGDHNLTITVIDRCGNSVTVLLRLVADLEPPTYVEFILRDDLDTVDYNETTRMMYITSLKKDDGFVIKIINITDDLSGVNYVLIPPIDGRTGGFLIPQAGYFSKWFSVREDGVIEGTYTFIIYDNVSNALKIELTMIDVGSLDAPRMENRSGVDENGTVTFSLSGPDSPFELDLHYRIDKGDWKGIGKFVPGDINNVTIRIFDEAEMEEEGLSKRVEFQLRDPLENIRTSKMYVIYTSRPISSEEDEDETSWEGSYVILVSFLVLLVILFGSLFLWIIPHKGKAPEIGRGPERREDEEDDIGGEEIEPVVEAVDLDEETMGEIVGAEWDDDEDDRDELIDAALSANLRVGRDRKGPEGAFPVSGRYPASEEEEEFECPDCGFSLREEDNVCYSCGAEFEEDEGGEGEEEDFKLEEEDDDLLDIDNENEVWGEEGGQEEEEENFELDVEDDDLLDIDDEEENGGEDFELDIEDEEWDRV